MFIDNESVFQKKCEVMTLWQYRNVCIIIIIIIIIYVRIEYKLWLVSFGHACHRISLRLRFALGYKIMKCKLTQL